MKRNKRTWLVLSMFIVAALLMSGCRAAATPTPTPTPKPAPPTPKPAPPTPEPTPVSPPAEGVSLATFDLNPRIAGRLAAGEKLVIRVSYHDVSNEFAPFLRKGTEQARDELGVDAEFVGPVGADAEAQVAEIESLIEAGVDGLAISSVSTDALAPVIDRALDMGIPVVTFNSDNPSSHRLAFAGQDLVTSGYEAGQVLVDKMGTKGKVLILTLDAAAQWSIDRETGARNALAEYPDIEVLATINTGTEPQEIYAAVENALLTYPDVEAILSMECCSHPVAGEVLVREGLDGKILMVGFDELPQTLKFIKEGVTAATVTQAPERQGYEAVNLLVRFLKGETITDVDTGIGVIDPDNVDKYLAPAEGVSLATFDLNPRIAGRLAAGEKLVIRVSYHDVSNEFAPFLRKGTEQARDELGVDAEFVGPVGADAEAQVAEIESLIEAGVDGLAISSVSTDALAPVIDRALDMGIPVVTFNSDNPSSHRLAFAGQDLVTSGYEAGQVLVDKMGTKGKVLILTLDAAAQWSIDRETGARNALAEYPDIEVLATINTGTEPQEIYAAVENALLTYPDVEAILSMECCSHPVAGEVLVREGLDGKILMVGFDELPQTLKFIKEGVTAATVTQAPERQGYEAVNLLVRFLKGETITDVDTGIGVIDPDNVDKYLQ
jgi:simple sugar transport system substrate-binding protein